MDTSLLTKIGRGLGLRNFSEWNKVLCLRFIWLLFSKSNSLWVQWHKHHHLRNISFWALEQKTTNSVSWNSIFSLRPIALTFIKCRVNDGETCRFWYDCWTPFGHLIDFLGANGPRDLRLPISAHVKDAISPTGWRLSQPRSDSALELHIHLTTVNLPLGNVARDSLHWIIEGKDSNGFSSSKT